MGGSALLLRHQPLAVLVDTDGLVEIAVKGIIVFLVLWAVSLQVQSIVQHHRVLPSE